MIILFNGAGATICELWHPFKSRDLKGGEYMEESVQTQEENQSGMPLKLIGLAVVIIVLGVGGYFFLQGNKLAEQPKQEAVTQTEQAKNAIENNNVKEATGGARAVTAGGAGMAQDIKSFTVESSNFSFNLKEIKVKKGDTVDVKFVNKSGFHDFVIDEFNVKTKQIAAGNTEEVSFVASKSGTFEYYCSVGKHRQMGMVGKLIVE